MAEEKDHGTASKRKVPIYAEFIDIDINAEIPLSKKAQRLLKKGKKTRAEVERVLVVPKEYVDDAAGEDGGKVPETNKEGRLRRAQQNTEKNKEWEYSVWMGNLSFKTTASDLQSWMLSHKKTENRLSEHDIKRVNVPSKFKKSRGFAYVDFYTYRAMYAVIDLSEETLHGRRVLIKRSSDFEGRPTDGLAPTVVAYNHVIVRAEEKNAKKLISASNSTPLGTKEGEGLHAEGESKQESPPKIKPSSKKRRAAEEQIKEDVAIDDKMILPIREHKKRKNENTDHAAQPNAPDHRKKQIPTTPETPEHPSHPRITKPKTEKVSTRSKPAQTMTSGEALLNAARRNTAALVASQGKKIVF